MTNYFLNKKNKSTPKKILSYRQSFTFLLFCLWVRYKASKFCLKMSVNSQLKQKFIFDFVNCNVPTALFFLEMLYISNT